MVWRIKSIFSFCGMVKYGSSFIIILIKAGAVRRILGTTGVFSWDMRGKFFHQGPLKVNFTNLPNPMNPVVILVVTVES